MPLVLSVNRVHALLPRGPKGGDTAIDKRPTAGPVRVGRLGLAGDRQMDVKHHGGPLQAVYAYAGEDLDWWSRELGREIPHGFFGENLTTAGIDVGGARQGERWRLGEADEDGDTLGGLAAVLAGRVPTVGEQVDHPSGWRLEIVEADERRINRLRLHPPVPAPEDPEE